MKLYKFAKKQCAVLLITGGLFGSVQASLPNSEAEANLLLVHRTYQWFNDISSTQRVSYSEQDVANYFSENAQMITNGKVVCTGIHEHYQHFIELNEHYQSLQVNLDTLSAVAANNLVFLDYTILGVDKAQRKHTIHVMGTMVFEQGKIQLFKEVISKDSESI